MSVNRAIARGGGPRFAHRVFVGAAITAVAGIDFVLGLLFIAAYRACGSQPTDA